MKTCHLVEPQSMDPSLGNNWEPGRFIVFLHIQKTAGSTVQRYLRTQFGPWAGERLRRKVMKDPRNRSTIVDAAKARTASDGYFVGHFCFGMHRFLPHPATYMTFLRDPLARIVSLYSYSRHTPHAYYHKHAKRYDLVGFVRDSGLMEIDNGMVRFLAGSQTDPFLPRVPVGTVDTDMLDRAKDNLSRYFFFCGIMEQFDESFLLLRHKLGDRSSNYLRMNSRALPKPDMDASTRKLIEHRIELDRALYDFACKRFAHEVTATFPDMSKQLARFRASNVRYNSRRQLFYKTLQKIRGGSVYG